MPDTEYSTCICRPHLCSSQRSGKWMWSFPCALMSISWPGAVTPSGPCYTASQQRSEGGQPALLGSKTHALSTPPKLNHKNADQTQIKGRTWAHAQAHLSQGKGWGQEGSHVSGVIKSQEPPKESWKQESQTRRNIMEKPSQLVHVTEWVTPERPWRKMRKWIGLGIIIWTCWEAESCQMRLV